MLIEMRARSQITLPNEIIKSLGVNEGDKFEIFERDGGIFLCPVVVYPKAKLEQIAKIIKDHEKNPSAVYESVEDMFKQMELDINGFARFLLSMPTRAEDTDTGEAGRNIGRLVPELREVEF